VINLLTELQERLEITMLFIAHDLSVVRHVTDRVAVMYLGNILEIGPTETVFESPANPYTLSLLSAIPGSSSPAPTGLDRVALRGSPPNPRYPPDGCPFATRCPAKVRPDAAADLSDDAWEAIEAFRRLLRERARQDEPVTRTILRRVGLVSNKQSVESIRSDLFAGVELPSAVADTIATATDRAYSSPAAAADLLAEEFGSVCDQTDGEVYTVGDGSRQSQCVRHGPAYDAPADAFD
jgi:oligopeptide/dipeptide ABC transporter, ATP-binding protein, C-terminal domain